MNPLKELEDAIAAYEKALEAHNRGPWASTAIALEHARDRIGGVYLVHHAAVMAVLRAAVELSAAGSWNNVFKLKNEVDRLLAGGEEAR